MSFFSNFHATPSPRVPNTQPTQTERFHVLAQRSKCRPRSPNPCPAHPDRCARSVRISRRRVSDRRACPGADELRDSGVQGQARRALGVRRRRCAVCDPDCHAAGPQRDGAGVGDTLLVAQPHPWWNRVGVADANPDDRCGHVQRAARGDNVHVEPGRGSPDRGRRTGGRDRRHRVSRRARLYVHTVRASPRSDRRPGHVAGAHEQWPHLLLR